MSAVPTAAEAMMMVVPRRLWWNDVSTSVASVTHDVHSVILAVNGIIITSTNQKTGGIWVGRGWSGGQNQGASEVQWLRLCSTLHCLNFCILPCTKASLQIQSQPNFNIPFTFKNFTKLCSTLFLKFAIFFFFFTFKWASKLEITILIYWEKVHYII